jgi:hypothetical protein
MSLWSVSLKNGSLAEFSGKAERHGWLESHLEHLLALNPQLLGVERELPLNLAGGSHRNMPDQSFVDEMGRVTVVELKNEEATPLALMQVLAYSAIWRGLPLGESSTGVRWLTHEGMAARELGRALEALEAWLTGASETKEPEAWSKRGKGPLKRGTFWWANKAFRSVEEHGSGKFEDTWRSWPAPPSRAVLVAPAFSRECLALAEELVKRQYTLELHEAELMVPASGRDQVVVRWEERLKDHAHEHVWRAAKALWKNPWIREHFGPNGWADHLSLSTFSLSSRQAPLVKIWIEYKDGTILLSTALPDNWQDGSKRRELRRTLLGKLPPPDEIDRWIVWNHPVDESDAVLAARGEAIGRALHEILVPLDGELG